MVFLTRKYEVILFVTSKNKTSLTAFKKVDIASKTVKFHLPR
jgi:hypothetical protein